MMIAVRNMCDVDENIHIVQCIFIELVHLDVVLDNSCGHISSTLLPDCIKLCKDCMKYLLLSKHHITRSAVYSNPTGIYIHRLYASINWVIIGSDKGLSFFRFTQLPAPMIINHCQLMTVVNWTFRKRTSVIISVRFETSSYIQMHSTKSSAQRLSFCLGLNVH